MVAKGRPVELTWPETYSTKKTHTKTEIVHVVNCRSSMHLPGATCNCSTSITVFSRTNSLSTSGLCRKGCMISSTQLAYPVSCCGWLDKDWVAGFNCSCVSNERFSAAIVRLIFGTVAVSWLPALFVCLYVFRFHSLCMIAQNMEWPWPYPPKRNPLDSFRSNFKMFLFPKR